MNFIKNFLRKYYEAYFGSSYARKIHSEDTAEPPSLEKGIEAIRRKWGDFKPDCKDDPIFIFSAGWRSGSTLLQRLVVSSDDVLVWGEPYGHAALIPSIARTISSISDDWPSEEYNIKNIVKDGENIENKWIANMYPDIEDLYAAHINYFQTLFMKPARAMGKNRWGLKEVRLGTDYALYLRWLFPNAKFLFLVRNPYKAYESYYKMSKSWYWEWPNDPVFTPGYFGLKWKSLAKDFFENADKVDGLFLKYEDLLGDERIIDTIDDYLGIRLDRSVLQKKIGGKRDNSHDEVIEYEKRIVEKKVKDVAVKLGYYL